MIIGLADIGIDDLKLYQLCNISLPTFYNL